MVYLHMHQDLIELCRHGDRNAQLKLYKLYYKAMYNTSLRIVKNEAEAEDLMQESFLDAFRKLDTYKGDASFGSWLKRIVINNSLDALKKRKINWESLDDGYKEPYLIQEETATEEVDQWKVEEVKKDRAAA